jgi:hypothetical protein
MLANTAHIPSIATTISGGGRDHNEWMKSYLMIQGRRILWWKYNEIDPTDYHAKVGPPYLLSHLSYHTRPHLTP